MIRHEIIQKPGRFWVLFRKETLQCLAKMNNSHLQPTLTNLRHSFYRPKVWRTLSWVDSGIFRCNNFTQNKDQTSFFPQMLLPNNLGHLELHKSSMSIIRSVRIAYLVGFVAHFSVFVWCLVVAGSGNAPKQRLGMGFCGFNGYKVIGISIRFKI